jgi:Holliday junction resolvase RusA-like endonuclease
VKSFRFYAKGLPVTQGSSSIGYAGDGRAYIRSASGKKLKDWRRTIADAARDAANYPGRYAGAVSVTATFFWPRPKGHYLPANSRRAHPELHHDAPRYVTSKPDADKLARALLDALVEEAALLADDAQVVEVVARKAYADDHPVGVAVDVEVLL